MQQRTVSRILVLPVVVALSMQPGTSWAAKKQRQAETVITEAELQLELMSYADRYAASVAQAIDDVERLDPPTETRRVVLGDMVFSAAAAFTTAADPEVDLALLDLVVMTTLGRMVWEDYWRPRLGAIGDPVIAALTKLESDVWTVAAPILSELQRRELRERIKAFHSANPELSTFSHLRFADFPSRQEGSTLKKSSGPGGGIFSSVKHVSEQVEKTRILAERGMYVATRLPLLSGGFADIWVSRLAANPAIDKVLADTHAFSEVAERFAVVAEGLPETITTQRREAIEQLGTEVSVLREEGIDDLFQHIAVERQEIIRRVTAADEQLGALLTSLSKTLAEANTLVAAADDLAVRFDKGPEADPFEIEPYRLTIDQAGVLVQQLTTLLEATQETLDSPGVERLTPAVNETIDAVGRTTHELVDYSFYRALILIVLALVGSVIAMLGYRWLARRMFPDAT